MFPSTKLPHVKSLRTILYLILPTPSIHLPARRRKHTNRPAVTSVFLEAHRNRLSDPSPQTKRVLAFTAWLAVSEPRPASSTTRYQFCQECHQHQAILNPLGSARVPPEPTLSVVPLTPSLYTARSRCCQRLIFAPCHCWMTLARCKSLLKTTRHIRHRQCSAPPLNGLIFQTALGAATAQRRCPRLYLGDLCLSEIHLMMHKLSLLTRQ